MRQIIWCPFWASTSTKDTKLFVSNWLTWTIVFRRRKIFIDLTLRGEWNWVETGSHLTGAGDWETGNDSLDSTCGSGGSSMGLNENILRSVSAGYKHTYSFELSWSCWDLKGDDDRRSGWSDAFGSAGDIARRVDNREWPIWKVRPETAPKNNN